MKEEVIADSQHATTKDAYELNFEGPTSSTTEARYFTLLVDYVRLKIRYFLRFFVRCVCAYFVYKYLPKQCIEGWLLLVVISFLRLRCKLCEYSE